MTTSFPAALDTFPAVATLQVANLSTNPHSALHANLGDSVAALEAKVGITSSAVTTSLDYRLFSQEAQSASFTADQTYTWVTTGATTRTATLPTALGIAGRQYTIKKVDSGIGLVVLDADSAQTIDGALTYTLYAQYDSVTIVSDGANWWVV